MNFSTTQKRDTPIGISHTNTYKIYSIVIPTLALSKSGTVETIVSSQPVSQAPDTI